MAVGFSNTNKPINPRGNDQSPKGYNRAALYSGKALDFDGVNDYIQADGVNETLDNYTLSWNLKTSSTQNFSSIFSNSTDVFDIYVKDNGQLRFYTNTAYDSTNLPALNDGKWKNFVLSISGTSLNIYVNGVLSETLSIADLSRSIANIRLGYIFPNLYAFNGEMGGFKIFNTALTAAQVADLYNNPEKVVPTGVDNTALKLWLPMQEGAGTTAFNGAPDALGSEEVTNGDFATDSDWSKTGDWEISGGSANSDGTTSISNLSQNITFEVGKTYRYSFTISNRTQGGVRAYIGAATGVLNESNGIVTGSIVYSSGTSFVLQSRNNFIGSVDNVSIKEENNFGTISGATWTHGIGAPVAQTAVISWNKVIDSTYEYLIPQGLTSGRDLLGNLFENVRKQGALNLDGNSWAEVHDNASLDVTDAITLEAWVYAEDSLNRGILGKWDFNGGKMSYLLLRGGDGSLRFYTSATGGTIEFATSTTTITNGNWYHLVGTDDGTNLSFYLNGSLEDTSTSFGSIYESEKDVEIGRHGYGAIGEINGSIAQPRIYNRALTAAEVLQNYNSGKNTYK
jgi:hypothetical protein